VLGKERRVTKWDRNARGFRSPPRSREYRCCVSAAAQKGRRQSQGKQTKVTKWDRTARGRGSKKKVLGQGKESHQVQCMHTNRSIEAVSLQDQYQMGPARGLLPNDYVVLKASYLGTTTRGLLPKTIQWTNTKGLL